ncbi:hypothetical protein NKR23_g8615 [Pleurostoma richardsiae]|uniref:N-acetyltransferase domain-containing protein n=1 Tax=Pleurostoma richardsiae TaxID=41990 RepID=A0AA38RHM2_9PEZI|nr:hypothetical protein NKR23_g8615 [Pleurostoma richardsiae]
MTTSAAPAADIRLEPAVEADIDTLANIANLTFHEDRHTLLKAAYPARPYDHGEGMKACLENWISVAPSGRIQLTKAVDPSTGEILGWVCWGSRGFDNAAPAPAAPAPAPPQPKEEADKPAGDALAELEALTSADMAAFMARTMRPGEKWMFIVSIAVSPAHQGRGVGSALIRSGTDRADEAGAPCWVHASEAGAASFRARGFAEDARLEIDLDEWAGRMGVGPPPEGQGLEEDGGGRKWGKYVFRYMIRRPVV